MINTGLERDFSFQRGAPFLYAREIPGDHVSQGTPLFVKRAIFGKTAPVFHVNERL
jgi:hypothetical protein